MEREPYALKSGDAWTYSQFGTEFAVKVRELASGNGVAILEYTSGAGEEPPDHTHPTEDEIFYLAEGAVTFRCGDRTLDAEQGSFVFLPRGIEHGYTIRSQSPARLVVITAPTRSDDAGWGGFTADIEREAELVARPRTAG